MADPKSRAGARYADSEVMQWVADVHASHDPALQAAFDAPDSTELPAIQVSQSEGRFLEFLAAVSGAKKIVEIGTLAGYSAIRLARGGGEGARVWTVEYDPRHAEVARQRLEAAGLSDRVEVLVGAGVDVLPTLEAHGPFDLVFVDADKESYHLYGRWAADNLRSGGLLVGDNAFLFGKLTEDTERGQAMRTFHREPAEAGWLSVCLPTPDGMLLARKP